MKMRVYVAIDRFKKYIDFDVDEDFPNLSADRQEELKEHAMAQAIAELVDAWVELLPKI